MWEEFFYLPVGRPEPPQPKNPERVNHLILKGINGRPLFLDDQDYKRFLSFLNKHLKTFDSRIYAFLLMTNHTHQLIVGDHIDELANALVFSYESYYRQKYHLKGHLFIKPVAYQKAVLSWQADTLLYIINNPLLANMTSSWEKYQYSSYQFYTKAGSQLKCFISVDCSLVNRCFDSIQALRSAANKKLQYDLKLKELK
jgi:putative transposase